MAEKGHYATNADGINHFDDWIKEQEAPDGLDMLRKVGVFFSGTRLVTPFPEVIERMAQGYQCTSCGEPFVTWVPKCPVCHNPNHLGGYATQGR